MILMEQGSHVYNSQSFEVEYLLGPGPYFPLEARDALQEVVDALNMAKVYEDTAMQLLARVRNKFQ